MNQRRVILVADLGYGDAGKGSLVDFLTRQLHASVVIRYNGGAQAAHNVIDPDGRYHTFAQFGSGTLVPGVRTHLSRFMLVEPLSLLREERHLQTLGITDALDRLTIDRGALVTTPYHQALNRLREITRGDGRHGSCGMGVGETMADALALGAHVPRMGDLHDPVRVKRKLQILREWKLTQLQTIRAGLPDTELVRRERQVLEDAHFLDFIVETYRQFARRAAIVEPSFLTQLLAEGTVIAEGAQGVLLDEWYGFHPYTTWSTTTFQNVDTLLREQHYDGQVVRLGVLRAYATRHGPGPFVTEDTALGAVLPERHNAPNAWQLAMRVGHFDAVAARYALAVIRHVDLLAVTHVDRLHDLKEWKIATQYEYRGNMDRLSDFFAVRAGLMADIRASEEQDLARQEQLTLRLQHCVPHYVVHRASHSLPATEADVSSYLVQIERELGVPIGLVSAGPTALDKLFTAAWARHVEHQLPLIVKAGRD
jgi:adenylosuccinate synthase